jgi:hypothetical protein
MGYTTDFTGAIELGRKLTMAEAKELLEIATRDDAEKVTGIDAYFQWVPSEDMGHIVWDGNEKFYKYKEQLAWLCGWLSKRTIIANGRFYWQGEETGDTGTLVVANNSVVAYPDDKPATKSPKPLTLRSLQEMALNAVTNGDGT